jgi:hypothetical protein
MPGSIDDEICPQRFAAPIGILTANRRNRCVPSPRDESLYSATLSYPNIAIFFQPFAHSELKQRPRHAVDRDAEVPLRKGVISRALYAIVVTHAKPHSAGLSETLLKTGE